MYAKKISSYFFIIFLLFVFLTITIQFFVKNVMIDKLHLDNRITQLCASSIPNQINDNELIFTFEDKYSGQDLVEYPKDEVDDLPEFMFFSKLSNITGQLDYIKSQLELYSKDYLFGVEQYKFFSGYFDVITNNHMVDNNNSVCYDSDNKLLIRSPFSEICSPDISKEMAGYIKLNNILEQENIPFLYVTVLNSENKYDQQLTQKYGESEWDIKADELINGLNMHNINNIDLRELYHISGQNHKSAFYSTDGHWNSKAGLWATREIASWLNTNYDFDFNLNEYDESMYEIISYNDSCFNTIGQSATLARLKKEPLDIFSPKHKYNLIFTNYETGEVRNGDFINSIVNKKVLETPSSTYIKGYACFMNSNGIYASVENTTSLYNKSKTILVVGNSFRNVVVPYLSLQCNKVDSICCSPFSGSVVSFIKETKPDLVIICQH